MKSKQRTQQRKKTNNKEKEVSRAVTPDRNSLKMDVIMCESRHPIQYIGPYTGWHARWQVVSGLGTSKTGKPTCVVNRCECDALFKPKMHVIMYERKNQKI